MGKKKKKQKFSAKDWKRFLDEEVGTAEDEGLEFRRSMDTEEALEKSEVLRYFQNRRLDPEVELALATAFEELSPKVEFPKIQVHFFLSVLYPSGLI